VRYADRMKRGLDAHTKALLDHAALSDYAQAHMGARSRLTDAQIGAHAEANGRHPDTLAYVPHFIAAGRKSPLQRAFRHGARPVFPGQPHNGELLRKR
jgi:hypothetical protein